MCSIFRNEGPDLSSELIREACAITRFFWTIEADPWIITFVDPAKVRRKRDAGRCFLRAGFTRVGTTKKSGLLVFGLCASDVPDPMPPRGEA